MDGLIKLTLIWLAIDLLMVGTAWYTVVTIPHLWPTWWRHVVVDSVGPEVRL